MSDSATIELLNRCSYAETKLEELQSQLSQALRDRDEARTARLGTMVRAVDAAKSERDQALRELGEARDGRKLDGVSLAIANSELTAALRSTADLTRERDGAYKRFDTAVEHRNRVIGALDAARLDNAELRGALGNLIPRFEACCRHAGNSDDVVALATEQARTALASSSTKET